MPSAAGQAGGAAAEAQGIAVNDILGAGSQDYMAYGQELQNLTGPALDQYVQYLEGITSGNTVDEMSAAAPTISNITTQTNAAKQQLRQLPRGGEQDYLSAQIDASGASQIGTALNQAFTSAQQQLGAVGEAGISQYLSALGGYNQSVGEAANIELGASGAYANVAQINESEFASILQTISSLGGAAADAYGSYSAGGQGAGALIEEGALLAG